MLTRISPAGLINSVCLSISRWSRVVAVRQSISHVNWFTCDEVVSWSEDRRYVSKTGQSDRPLMHYTYTADYSRDLNPGLSCVPTSANARLDNSTSTRYAPPSTIKNAFISLQVLLVYCCWITSSTPLCSAARQIGLAASSAALAYRTSQCKHAHVKKPAAHNILF